MFTLVSDVQNCEEKLQVCSECLWRKKKKHLRGSRKRCIKALCTRLFLASSVFFLYPPSSPPFLFLLICSRRIQIAKYFWKKCARNFEDVNQRLAPAILTAFFSWRDSIDRVPRMLKIVFIAVAFSATFRVLQIPCEGSNGNFGITWIVSVCWRSMGAVGARVLCACKRASCYVPAFSLYIL